MFLGAVRRLGAHDIETTKGPMWGYPVPVLGAISPFLEPFRGRLSPNIDNVSEKLTLRYPHEGPWVVRTAPVLDSRTTTSQKCEAVPRRARIQGSWTFVPLNSRLERNEAEEEEFDLPERASARAVGRVLLDAVRQKPHTHHLLSEIRVGIHGVLSLYTYE